VTRDTDRLRLARCAGVGPVLYRRLLTRFGTAAAAIEALPQMARSGGRTQPLSIPTVASVHREMDALAAIGGHLLFLGEPDYPELLALLDDAPPALSVLGDIAVLRLPAVAMVGSRNASANGMILAGRIAEQLATTAVVVSGLARGIDTAAHQGALRTGTQQGAPHTGTTVACVAGGLDKPYPPENIGLQRRIAEAGAVVAEAPLGTAPQSRHFPRRNRVIAGLSLGVVVVEAALRSGSLITARLGLEAGREIFAVPGSPLDPRCAGTNALLRDGAHLTETAADVFANLPDHPRRAGLSRDPLFRDMALPEGVAEPQIALVTPASALAAVTHLLGPAPTLVDDLVRRCQLSAPEVRAALLDLELAGRVETLPGNRVALLAGTD
jgi:DNA processing protein